MAPAVTALAPDKAAIRWNLGAGRTLPRTTGSRQRLSGVGPKKKKSFNLITRDENAEFFADRKVGQNNTQLVRPVGGPNTLEK